MIDRRGAVMGMKKWSDGVKSDGVKNIGVLEWWSGGVNNIGVMEW